MACKKSCEEKRTVAKAAGALAGYGAYSAAASTAVTAVPATTVTIGASSFAIGGVAAVAPIIAPVLAASLVGIGVVYLVKKILD